MTEYYKDKYSNIGFIILLIGIFMAATDNGIISAAKSGYWRKPLTLASGIGVDGGYFVD